VIARDRRLLLLAGLLAAIIAGGCAQGGPEIKKFPPPAADVMHLGFHIYDLGFQSPDSQAARPLVWTTTLLLLTIVVSLNLVAIIIRARLRARLSGSTV